MSVIGSDISHTTFEKGVIVFHLTPLGIRNHRLFNKRWNAEQARIRRVNARYSREWDREMNRNLRRGRKQRRELMQWLKSGKPSGNTKHKCAPCGKIRYCKKDRDHWFCADCIKLGPGKKIEVRCPKHKEWCGGRYGTCSSCFGESAGSGSLI